LTLDDVFKALDASAKTLERLNDANAPVQLIGEEVQHRDELMKRMWELIWRETRNGKGRKKGRRTRCAAGRS